MLNLNEFPVFDSHLHVIDTRYPLMPNNGYVPDPFTASDYLTRMGAYNLCGGAIVSGSFQGFDQDYLIDALQQLGTGFVGVTQLPNAVADEEIVKLNAIGVRAVRFNLKRGGSEGIEHLQSMAARIHEIAGWHVELYVDSTMLADLYAVLTRLPAVSIDHLGLSRAGFKVLLQLVEKGVKVKATGFGRVDFPVKEALRDLYSANPGALMFGSDLPSTRAPRAYTDRDFALVIEALGREGATDVLSRNAINFYKPAQRTRTQGPEAQSAPV